MEIEFMDEKVKVYHKEHGAGIITAKERPYFWVRYDLTNTEYKHHISELMGVSSKFKMDGVNPYLEGVNPRGAKVIRNYNHLATTNIDQINKIKKSCLKNKDDIVFLGKL